jgi:hypothetical protein
MTSGCNRQVEHVGVDACVRWTRQGPLVPSIAIISPFGMLCNIERVDYFMMWNNAR